MNYVPFRVYSCPLPKPSSAKAGRSAAALYGTAKRPPILTFRTYFESALETLYTMCAIQKSNTHFNILKLQHTLTLFPRRSWAVNKWISDLWLGKQESCNSVAQKPVSFNFLIRKLVSCKSVTRKLISYNSVTRKLVRFISVTRNLSVTWKQVSFNSLTWKLVSFSSVTQKLLSFISVTMKLVCLID